MSPRVSVVVPCHDNASTIAEALGSLEDAGVDDLEVILVDDASSDDTVDVALEVRPDLVVVRLDENQGPAGARNRGVAVARAPVVGFLDSDDRLPADSIAVRLAGLDRHPELGGVVGRVRWVDPSAYLRRAGFAAGDVHWQAHFGAILVRRSVFDEVGPIDESYRIGEDVDWFMRAIEHGVALARIESVVYHQHHREDSVTRGATGNRHGIPRAIMAAHLRHRRQGRAAGRIRWLPDLPVIGNSGGPPP